MAAIRHIKHPPKVVESYFIRHFPNMNYHFYTYDSKNKKIYAAEVSTREGRLFDNSHQATLSWFKNKGRKQRNMVLLQNLK